jgi:hypothetical protein
MNMSSFVKRRWLLFAGITAAGLALVYARKAVG